MLEVPLSTVAIAGTEIVLQGRVCQMNAHGIALNLGEFASMLDQVEAGQAANAMFALVHGQYVARTTIAGCEPADSLLRLRLDEPIRPAQRRQARRFKIHLAVLARAIYDDGAMDDWQETETIDLSVGGAGLRIRRCRALPSNVDVKLTLPGERKSFSVRCRVAHGQAHGAGQFTAGLQFLNLKVADSARLVAFLEEIV